MISESPGPSPPQEGRRRFLARLAIGLGAFLAAASGVPLLGALLSPATRRDEPTWVQLGRLADFVVGAPRMVTFGLTKADAYLRITAPRAVWVYRVDEERVVIYNARCTHLGCLVNYQHDSQTFLSPCHSGLFALRDGTVLEGPPPRPLDRLEHRVDDGSLAVRYRDFVVGVPNQVPL